MNNASLETLKAAYAKAQEMGRTHVRFNESGKASYYQTTGKNGAYSLQEIQDRIIDLDCPLEAVVFEDDEMPTDKEFGELGFKFEIGDVVTNKAGSYSHVISRPDEWNEKPNQIGDFKIKSLVPRKNMGVQPCGDKSLVNVHFDTLSTSTNEADCYGWDFIGSDDITHWTPSKENFIKKQPEQAPVSDTCPSDATVYVSELKMKVKRLEFEVEYLKKANTSLIEDNVKFEINFEILKHIISNAK